MTEEWRVNNADECLSCLIIVQHVEARDNTVTTCRSQDQRGKAADWDLISSWRVCLHCQASFSLKHIFSACPNWEVTHWLCIINLKQPHCRRNIPLNNSVIDLLSASSQHEFSLSSHQWLEPREDYFIFWQQHILYGDNVSVPDERKIYISCQTMKKGTWARRI